MVAAPRTASTRQVSYLRAMLILSSLENDLELDHIEGFPTDAEQFLDRFHIEDEQVR